MKQMTLQQIANTPENEYINIKWWDQENSSMYCPFCGRRLWKHSEGWGRDKMTWYDDCECEGVKAAIQHNIRCEQLKKSATQETEKKDVQANAVSTVSVPRRGSVSFAGLVGLLKEHNLYVRHETSGEPIAVDGILVGRLASDMHKKLVVVDDDTTCKSLNWDLSVSFMSEDGSENLVLKVLEALSQSDRPYQHVVVSDVQKAKKILEELF